MRVIIVSWLSVLIATLVSGQGFMPMNRLRKSAPDMDGQSNDIYQNMEHTMKQAISGVPGGMAVLYNSAPIFSGRNSKDPEEAAEVYHLMPESEAVKLGVEHRRLLEDALVEMGFPLEELTAFDTQSGKVKKIVAKKGEDNKTTQAFKESPKEEQEDNVDVQSILAALQGPLPYLRRGAWGK